MWGRDKEDTGQENGVKTLCWGMSEKGVRKWRKGFERLEKKGLGALEAIFCLILGGFLTSCLQIGRKDGILCASSGGIGPPRVKQRTKVKWQRRKLFRQPRAES